MCFIINGFKVIIISKNCPKYTTPTAPESTPKKQKMREEKLANLGWLGEACGGEGEE